MSVSERIIELFKKQPDSILPTSEIIKSLYPEEYNNIKNALHDPISSKEAKQVAKRHKAILHRRVLYHLNNLINERIIKITSIRGKGEKCFSLNKKAVMINSINNNNIIIKEEQQAFSQLEWYIEKKILSNIDQYNWINRLNAIIINVGEKNSKEVNHALTKLFPHINDVIGLLGFEEIINKENLEEITKIIKKIDLETRDNNRRVSLLIDFEKIKENPARDFIEAFSLINPKNISVIFSLNTKYLENHQRLIKHLIKEFSANNIKIRLHNKEKHEAPMIIGKAGVYTLEEEEWKIYDEELRNELHGICLSQISVGIDVSKYFSYETSPTEFRKFIIKVAKSLVESAAQQRKKGELYFSRITSNLKNPYNFFRFSNNYIRFWNYDWQQENYPHFVELLRSSAEEIENFSRVEETIFKSCGIPIRFNVILASTHGSFAKEIFSKRKYHKITIKKYEDLTSNEMKSFLEARQKILSVFKYNDRLRIFRVPAEETDEIIKELQYLFTNYKNPLICYDFNPRKKDLTLDYFMK